MARCSGMGKWKTDQLRPGNGELFCHVDHSSPLPSLGHLIWLSPWSKDPRWEDRPPQHSYSYRVIQIGPVECLLIVGGRLSVWQELHRPLTRQDLTLVALEPAT